jgi:hypothetical protein
MIALLGQKRTGTTGAGPASRMLCGPRSERKEGTAKWASYQKDTKLRDPQIALGCWPVCRGRRRYQVAKFCNMYKCHARDLLGMGWVVRTGRPNDQETPADHDEVGVEDVIEIARCRYDPNRSKWPLPQSRLNVVCGKHFSTLNSLTPSSPRVPHSPS